ncbi:MAG: thioredoxin domain-containing protein [Deltaproteobacteria bacterium]|nr:MAG: thioredoxin domain-containing protein [Deltaproteobacteria bacterium]
MLPGWLRSEFALEKLGVCEHRRQQIVEVVRHAAHHGAEGLELVLAPRRRRRRVGRGLLAMRCALGEGPELHDQHIVVHVELQHVVHAGRHGLGRGRRPVDQADAQGGVRERTDASYAPIVHQAVHQQEVEGHVGPRRLGIGDRYLHPEGAAASFEAGEHLGGGGCDGDVQHGPDRPDRSRDAASAPDRCVRSVRGQAPETAGERLDGGASRQGPAGAMRTPTACYVAGVAGKSTEDREAPVHPSAPNEFHGAGPCVQASVPPGGGGGGPLRGGYRLRDAASPYLRQHADNPVEWYPWSDEPFERARREDKPLLVSIGYSTCHWCHVMERESFSDEDVAAFLNEHFVCIKVDREEHPEVDAFYIEAVGAMGESTGWPLNVFCTPDRHPFYGGTYFPPRPRWGRPSFRQVLEAVLDAFRNRRADLEVQARRVSEAIDQAMVPEQGPTDVSVVERSLERIERAFDPVYGGFGTGQKFPNAPLLGAVSTYLAGRRNAGGALAEHLHRTLDAMERGGVRDQVGGTFHRYAVDRAWHVPHFEKTLYDNAQLVEIYLRAWWRTGLARWLDVAVEIAEDLATWQTEDGGLIVGFDADDPTGEGGYYTWTVDELVEALGAENGRFVAELFDVAPPGVEELGGRCVLHRIDDARARERFGPDAPEDVLRRWHALRPVVARARAERPPPPRDDKLLVGWNGLAATAFAELGRMAGRDDFVARAAKIARFLTNGALDGRGVLRRGRVGEAWLGRARLEDFALSALGLARVHAATGDMTWLEKAYERIVETYRRFRDPRTGAFRRVGDDATADGPLPPVVCDAGGDGVLPGGASAAIRAGLELGSITGDMELLESAVASLEAYAGAPNDVPFGHGTLIETLSWWNGEVHDIVVVGEGGTPAFEACVRLVAGLPAALVSPVIVDRRRPVPAGFSNLADKLAAARPVAAYLCRRGACEAPVETPEALHRRLVALGGRWTEHHDGGPSDRNA